MSGHRWAIEDTNSRHWREYKHNRYSYPVLHERYAPANRGWDYKRIPTHWYHGVGHRYDALIARWGTLIVARCIRNRVLSNQVRRALKREEAVV